MLLLRQQGHHQPEGVQVRASTSWQENVQEERIADKNMKRERKAKVEGRRENLGQVRESIAAHFPQVLGIKCASFGKPDNAIMEKNVLFNIPPSLQRHPQRMTSVGRARTRGRRRGRETDQDLLVEVPAPRRAQIA